jgi:hypothetical protein
LIRWQVSSAIRSTAWAPLGSSEDSAASRSRTGIGVPKSRLARPSRICLAGIVGLTGVEAVVQLATAVRAVTVTPPHCATSIAPPNAVAA